MRALKALIKFVVVSVGLLLIGIGVAALFAITQLESTIRRSIETTLSRVYQTQVTLDRIAFAPGNKALELHDLIIFNPPQFAEGTAMAFPNVTVEFDLASAFADTPAIDRIVLRDTVVNLRYEAGTGTNLRALYANATRFNNSDNGAGKGSRKRFVVKEFRCEAATLNLSSNFVPVSALKLTIDPFTLSDLESGKPVSAADIATVFIRSLFTHGLSVEGILGPVTDRIKEELQALTNEDEKAATAAE